MTDASEETRTSLIDNMSETAKMMYHEIYRDIRLADGIDKNATKGFDQDSEVYEVLKLNSNLALMLMELCVILSEEMSRQNVVERRFLLRRCVMICHEGYKYLFGFKENATTTAIRFLDAHSADYQEWINCINEAHKKYLQDFGTEEMKQLRDVAKHYSTDSMEFFNCVKNLDEETVAKMIASFMAFAQPLYHLTLLYLKNELGITFLLAGVERPPFLSIPQFKDLYLSRVVDQNIEKFGDLILKMDKIGNQGTMVLRRLGADSVKKELKPYLDDNLATHIFYVDMDILCAYKAFSQAENFHEQALSLAYLRLSVHEGIKKLYGFGNKHVGSYWYRLKEDFSDVIASCSLNIEELEQRLDTLSQMDYVHDENVAIFTHFGEDKHKNIPFEVIRYFEEETNALFYKVITIVINTLTSILPVVTSLMEQENAFLKAKNDQMIDDSFGKIKGLLELAKAKNPQLKKSIDLLLKFIKAENEKLKSLFK